MSPISKGPNRLGQVVIVEVFLLLVLSGCYPQNISTHLPGVETILPSEDGNSVYVLPDGRRILFYTKGELWLLDVATRQELVAFQGVGSAQWLDDELAYGWKGSPDGKAHYVLNLQLGTTVWLQPLQAGDEFLARHIYGATSIYTIETGNNEHTLLLLQCDSAGNATGGYSVEKVHNLDALLNRIAYKGLPPALPFNAGGENYPSPDSQYYYTCDQGRVGVLRIYSQQAGFLSSASASSAYPILTCYGWAWDSSGVYFQTANPGGTIHEPRVGPFQLLRVKP